MNMTVYSGLVRVVRKAATCVSVTPSVVSGLGLRLLGRGSAHRAVNLKPWTHPKVLEGA
jgi:hypothetical protein